jgi:hypothetical protein
MLRESNMNILGKDLKMGLLKHVTYRTPGIRRCRDLVKNKLHHPMAEWTNAQALSSHRESL